jgi:phenylacetate-CoA ligase
MGIINMIANWYEILNIRNLGVKDIEGLQQRQLRRLLRHVGGTSEFYQDLYRGIDLDNCSLQDLPIVTKSAMMDNYDRFVTDKRLKLREIKKWLEDKQNIGKYYLGEFSPFLTSGSTGEPAVITYHRKEADIIQTNVFANSQSLPDYNKLDHFRTIIQYLFGKRPRFAAVVVPRGNLEPIFKRAPKMHRLFVNVKVFSLLDPLSQIIEELNEFQPDQLFSNTFFIAQLAQEQLAGRLKLVFDHPMAFVAGAGEMLTSHTEELAKRAWNLKIQNNYGTMECYIMATSCSTHGQLHLMNHLCIIEVVDQHYQPVPLGQYGEKILLTNLFNYTQPIIRYEIMDITGFAERNCKCGFSHTTLLPVQGRTTDFFYFKKTEDDYEQIPPTLLLVAMFYMLEIRQYQIVQTARNELTVNYVPLYGASSVEKKLKQLLTDALSQKGLENLVVLRFKEMSSIPRDERSGKYKPLISIEPPGKDAN